MAGTFVRYGVPEIKRRVGDGVLRGMLVIDQVYAKYQHERLDLLHPRGGGAKFLENAIILRHGIYLNRLARAVTDGDLEDVMADCMEDLDDTMKALAPFELGVLRNSGNPRVLDGFSTIYNRPPRWPRLNDTALNSLRRRSPRRRGRRRG